MKHIISLSLLFLLVAVVSASPDSIETSPSAYENNEWTEPTWTYQSDDKSAFSMYDSEKVTYCNFSFENALPSSCRIDSVLVKGEGSVTMPIGQSVVCRVSWDGGSSWGSGHDFEFEKMEMNKTVNATDDTTWTRNKLTNDNFKVQLMYLDTGQEGCFTNQTYFITWNETAHMKHEIPYLLKRIDKAQIGDMILCSNHDEGIHWDRIASVKEHFGNWTIVDVWSGNVTIQYQDQGSVNRTYVWHHHGQVTENHRSLIYRNGTWIRISASEIRIGDEMRHICHQDTKLGPKEYVKVEDHFLKSETIYQIDRFNMTGIVYDIKTDDPEDYMFMTYISEKELEILHTLKEKYHVDLESYIDPIYQGKWTGYVDWLRVEVCYSLITEEWHEVESWYGQLIARSWSFIEAWHGQFEGFSPFPIFAIPVIMVGAVGIIYFWKKKLS